MKLNVFVYFIQQLLIILNNFNNTINSLRYILAVLLKQLDELKCIQFIFTIHFANRNQKFVNAFAEQPFQI